ncbi:MAG TPA: aminotransferase class I/II-fold pyridoxal phosphate-dependent enzyme [Acidimicrobiales bacterium]|nr:aminotransferase class I/II-fold pyridoxal phosphate-dependent enzyme [Acidimicrobiales bacterium]
MTTGFSPPPYPYDRLGPIHELAASHVGGAVDLSVGAPGDAPAPEVVAALGSSGTERGYPPSVGSPALREAAVGWMARRLGVEVPLGAVAACVGTKEFVATTPHYLRLRAPERDTVLYPAVSYPTYEMGAVLAGCRAVPVPVDERWRLDVSAIDDDDAARALCLWVNTPANPTGALDDLAAAAAWGRRRGVPVLSDECYVEFTWDGGPRTILEHGLDGVIAVHSLSKRSNLAGLRAGFYAGDPELVHYLAEVRKHVGMMVSGPVQAAAIAALGDDTHVDDQRARYRERLGFFADVLTGAGFQCTLPGGSFYLWAHAPGGDAWSAAADLARRGGLVTSPGEFYGVAGAGYLRLAMVVTMDRLRLVADRLGG